MRQAPPPQGKALHVNELRTVEAIAFTIPADLAAFNL
jgi:hypothetical protein